MSTNEENMKDMEIKEGNMGDNSPVSSSLSGNEKNIEQEKQVEDLKKQMMALQKQLEEQKKAQEMRGFNSYSYQVNQNEEEKIAKEMFNNLDFSEPKNMSSAERFRNYGNLFGKLHNNYILKQRGV